ncbi:hypothetical protein MKX03_019773 [Papaver bracteatum]|nr:hypothetical protein MKX03_019773 [Papaver bracteatum]
MEIGSSSVMPSSRVLMKKGSWSEAEDLLLARYIGEYGPGNWGQVPPGAGLNRSPKSCRLRWFNNLQPNVKRGEFELDEVDLIIRMHKLLDLGNRSKLIFFSMLNSFTLFRWSLIVGRLPGRTLSDVKNYYNTNFLKEKSTCFESNLPRRSIGTVEENHLLMTTKVYRPVPRKISEKNTEEKDHQNMSSSSTTNYK